MRFTFIMLLTLSAASAAPILQGDKLNVDHSSKSNASLAARGTIRTCFTSCFRGIPSPKTKTQDKEVEIGITREKALKAGYTDATPQIEAWYTAKGLTIKPGMMYKIGQFRGQEAIYPIFIKGDKSVRMER